MIIRFIKTNSFFILAILTIVYSQDCYAFDKSKFIDRFTFSIKAGLGWGNWKQVNQDASLEGFSYSKFTRFKFQKITHFAYEFKYFTSNRKWSLIFMNGERLYTSDYYFYEIMYFHDATGDVGYSLKHIGVSIERNFILHENYLFSIRNHYSLGAANMNYYNRGRIKHCMYGDYYMDEPRTERNNDADCILEDISIIGEHHGKRDRLLGLRMGTGLCFDFVTKGVKKHTLSFEIFYTKGMRTFFTETIQIRDLDPIVLGTNGSGIDLYIGYHINLGYLLYNKRFNARSGKKVDKGIRWYEGD